MPAYDFARLSSYDFQELVCDLLQAEWRIRLETFAAGSDSGIDLRGLATKGGNVIVQCKHMLAGQFRSFFSEIRRTELPKVRALSPRRYVLATSRAITPANKKQLRKLLSPYVRKNSDIIGKNDINNLLRRHPRVETNNFKLWLTSTAVLDRVLHNAERCQTEFEVDRVCRKLPLFVQNEAFPRARKLLNDTHIVVISGIPGIGKTTVADMLLYAHLAQGYEPVVIQGGVEDALKLFKKSVKQIFYFDDFLGQTFLHDRPDLLARNHDAALITFMDAVRTSKSSRFIMTTREHILKKALALSERLARSPILDHRCVVELSDYTFSQKARILYNHLYFSDLPVEYKKRILQNDFYLDIIQHEGFNPRLIEWLSGYIRVRQVAAENYQRYVEELLDNPDQIWSHAFNEQISEPARNILFCLATLSDFGEKLIDLEPAWQTLHRHKAQKYNFSTSPRDFRKALDEIEGSFIKIDDQAVDFLNPSIRDFLNNQIRGNKEFVEDLILSAVRFNQLANLWDLAAARPTSVFTVHTLANMPAFDSTLKRVVDAPYIRWWNTEDGQRRGSIVDASPTARLIALVSWAEEVKNEKIIDIALLLGERSVPSLSYEIGRFASVLRIVDTLEQSGWVLNHGGGSLHDLLWDSVWNNLSAANHSDWTGDFGLPKK